MLIVVTRYFGGILLGTGGLSRAYSKAAKEALEQTTYIKKTNGYEITNEGNKYFGYKICYHFLQLSK